MLIFNSGVAWLAPIAVATAIVGAAVLLAAGRFVPRFIADLFATTIAVTVTTLSAIILATTVGGRVVTWIAGWEPHHGFSVGIVMEADPVGAGIAMLAAALTTLALVYSWQYLDSVEAHYQALVLLFLAGMEGFALTGDLFDMFVYFELMGVAAYALTALHVEDPTALQGSLNFGIINSLGAYLSLMGVGLLYARTGNLGLPQLGNALAHTRPDALIVAAFILVLTGFLVKAAVVPFHFWLDDAHAVAPPPICLLFSGVMVPLGVYAVFRVYWTVFSDPLPAGDVRRAFLVMGALTACIAAPMCLGQRHIKRLLAYSTIAHMGLFLSALALLNTSGTAGAFLYIAGHAGAKGALFLLAGILLGKYGTVDEHELYGRGRGQLLLGMLWLIGGLALSAIPPFGTGLGKAVAEDAGMSAGYWYFPILFVITSGLTGGAVLRVGARVFYGLGAPPEKPTVDSKTEDESTEERFADVPITMLFPIILLLAGCLAEGLVPGAGAAGEHAGAYFVDPRGYIDAALSHHARAVLAPRPGNWTGLSIVLDFASGVLAVAVAFIGLNAKQIVERTGSFFYVGSIAFAGLRKLHSGHIGDYVAWLMMGVSVLAALIGLPLVHH